MDLNALFPFIVACLIIESTPGPNMAFLTLISVIKGRRAGFAMVAGIALGLAILGALAAFGMTQFLSRSPAAFNTLKYVGVLYLLALAVIEWRARPASAGPSQDADDYFRHGLIVNLLNPKAALFYVSVLPGFLPEISAGVRDVVIYTALYVGIATAVHGLIVLLAGTLEPVFNAPDKQVWLRRVFALLLAVIAIWIAVKM